MNPCLLCSSRSPKGSLYITCSDKDCVQYTFRISSLHATCCVSPSSIWSTLAAIFAEECMNFEAFHYPVFSSLLYFFSFGSKRSHLLTFIKVFSPFCSVNARDQVSRQYRTISSTVDSFIQAFQSLRFHIQDEKPKMFSSWIVATLLRTLSAHNLVVNISSEGCQLRILDFNTHKAVSLGLRYHPSLNLKVIYSMSYSS